MISLPKRFTGNQTTHEITAVSAMTTQRWTEQSHLLGTMAAMMEAFGAQACELLQDDASADPRRLAARVSLQSRGFPLSQLPRLPLGLFLDPQVMKGTLLAAGSSMAAVNASRLLADPRLSGRLVSPIRDLQGAIVSFWARHPKDEAPLYLFLHRQWRQSVPAICLDTALAAGGRHDLLLVEDPLDALLLHAHGLLNVAAVGGPFRELTGRRWRSLFEAGATRITLALDPPDLDFDTHSALEQAQRVGRLEQVEVIPWRKLRTWLAGNRIGMREDPQLFWARIRRERIAGRRCRLHAIQLPVHCVSWEAQEAPAMPPVAIAPAVEATVTPAPAVALVAQPPVTEPPASTVLPIRARSWRCSLHRCDETACFCFD